MAEVTDTQPSTRERILDAAFVCFARQGFAGTSMVDIAAAAQLSRTALYKHFPDKEDVFLAAVQRLNAGVLAAVTAAAQREGDLAERLAAVIEARASWAFELLQRSPHGRELIDEKNRLCGPLSAEANARFLALVERIIRAGLAGRPGSLPPRQAAALLVDAAAGVLGDETSEASARRRLRQLAAVFAAGLADRRDP
ncbi:TetR/AcrR family transcriptional regulator [Desertibaculum subflavum]|uniref:TetR/AcrR family transcriptional regulator n=1 Tax=Desertibaculum subflavum TaxID=2268458 RepID=UPI000E66EF3C